VSEIGYHDDDDTHDDEYHHPSIRWSLNQMVAPVEERTFQSKAESQ
jgi:hypothetical protein